ncbi:MAG TPA: helix-turn-helix domain-containing protein [Candidatus Nanoarchaeia archaeon]|nr:helix-turn-helix domain-containing protein [Candidatus Nanoarchaeia archaeon]
MVQEALRKIGLTEEEIGIYLLLLRKGSSKATLLSKDLGAARTTVYRFLASLHDKGLVGENIQDNVKYFSAVDPRRIPEIIEERAEELREKIPELTSLQGRDLGRAKVELYRGKEGMKTVMRDVLRSGAPYTFIGEVGKYFSEIPIFVLQWLRKIEKARIRGRLLCPADQHFKVAKTEEYRILPRELISGISTWTYGDKTALFIWSEPFFVVLVENEAVTRSNRKTFTYLWNTAKKPAAPHLRKTRLTPA